MKTFDTLSEAVNNLQKAGYNYNFALAENCISCAAENISLTPEQFEIDGVYRFEGETDPADEAVVYAISSHNGNIKGILVNAFGVYADNTTDALIAKLHIH
jgi:hypothetical protein